MPVPEAVSVGLGDGYRVVRLGATPVGGQTHDGRRVVAGGGEGHL